MKISRIRLKHFIGIKDGTGLDEVEVDFTIPTLPEIVMLFGKNGSGKTSLLSQLHPGSDSYDERKELIVPGKEGEKFVVISDGDDSYEILHVYRDGKVKSFVKHNGTELNPSGGVKNFASVVEERLGFTPDFFRVGKIGSNVVNFVDMISSDRKRFISKFMPSIEAWLAAGKVVSKKLTGLKKTISFLSDELGKLDSEENLRLTVSDADRVLRAHRAEAETSIARVAAIEERISSFPDWAVKGSNPHAAALAGASKAMNDAEATRATYEAQFPTLAGATSEMVAEKIARYEEEAASLNERAAVIDSGIGTARERTDGASSRLEAKREELKTVRKSSRESARIEETIAEAESELAEAESEISEHPLPPAAGSMSLADASATKANVWSAYEMVRRAASEASPEAHAVLAGHAGADVEASLSRVQEMASSRLQRARTLLDSKKTVLTMLRGQADQAKILENRPKDCRIDSCPFIASAVRFRNAPEQLVEAQRTVDAAAADERDANDVLTEAGEALAVGRVLNSAYRQLVTDQGIGAFPVAEHVGSLASLVALAGRSAKEISDAFEVQPTFRAFQARENVDALRAKIETLRERLEAARTSDQFLSSVERDIEDLKTEQDTANETIDSLTTDRATVAGEAAKVRRKLEILNNLSNALAVLAVGSADLDRIGRDHADAERIIGEARLAKGEVAAIRAEREDADRRVVPAQRLYDDARLKLARFEEYTANLAEIQVKYQIVKDVKDGLDPVKGVPTLLIGEYLRDIEVLANSLLDVAYGGAFRIGFRITDTDFFIEVHKENGGICRDVKEASQGQVAMIKTTLSLAIFESAIGRYNILCLDEIDSTLDENNRRTFLEILERQIRHLRLEQLFCISHNDSFDSARIGLILLPGHAIDVNNRAFMDRKQLVANLAHGERNG